MLSFITPALITLHRFRGIAVFAVLVIFYSLYGILSGTLNDGPVRFNAPDEAANHVFAVQVANGQLPRLPMTDAAVFSALSHPRSTRVVDAHIVPVSFLGLPVMYGLVASMVGKTALPIVGALIAALAVLLFYDALRYWCTEQVARLSAIIFALHPAWWYYASRGFFHNALFIAALIAATWFYTKAVHDARHSKYFLGALLCIVLAIFVRSVEVLWLAPLVLWLLWKERERWSLKLVVGAMTFGLIFVGLWVAMQTLLYGRILESGYLATLPSAADGTWLISLLKTIKHLVLPFGFYPYVLVSNIWQFGVLLFLPWWILAMVGIWTSRREKSWRLYIVVSVCLTLWLWLYYGSWSVVDSIGFNPLSLGNSLVRYWLPACVVWIPFIGLGLQKVGVRFGYKFLLIFTLALLSLNLVWLDPVEGLGFVASRVQSYRAAAVQALKIVPVGSLVIGDRADKVFFPERNVMVTDGRPVLIIPEVRQWLSANTFAGRIFYVRLNLLDASTELVLKQNGNYQASLITRLPDDSYLYALNKSK